MTFRHEGVSAAWVLRHTRLWGRDVLIDERGWPLCWGCLELVEPPRLDVEVNSFLTGHRFPRLGPPNAGVGLAPEPLAGERPGLLPTPDTAAPAAHRYGFGGFEPGALPTSPGPRW